MDYQENKSTNRKLHILIAHSQSLVREGLRAILKDDAKVAAISKVATCEDLKNQCTSPVLDLVIVHQELIEDIKILPKGHFVLLLTHLDKDMLLAAHKHDAHGYISTNVTPNVLLSILNLSQEEALIDPALTKWILSCISSEPRQWSNRKV